MRKCSEMNNVPETQTIADTDCSQGNTLVLPGQSPRGGYILSVLLKRTYDIIPDNPCIRADFDQALIPGDVPWENPMNSTTRYETDFIPFRALHDLPLGMTAHILIPSIDPDRPSSASPLIVEDVVRREIGFDGLLMCDDLCMGALSGSMADRTRAVLDAGCDIALHCSGDFEEMEAVASVAPKLAGEAARRFEAALACLKPAQPFDEVGAEALVAEILAEIA